MFEQKTQNGQQGQRSEISAHELHNLVSVIVAEAQLLQLDFSEEEADYASAVSIERAGRRLEQLIDQLVASGAIQAKSASVQRSVSNVHELDRTEVMEAVEN